MADRRIKRPERRKATRKIQEAEYHYSTSFGPGTPQAIIAKFKAAAKHDGYSVRLKLRADGSRDAYLAKILKRRYNKKKG